MRNLGVVCAVLACVMSGFGANGEELNVAAGETVTLAADASVSGGTVSGTLVLSEGMTLELTHNVFAAGSTLVLSNATLRGFAGTTEGDFANAFVIADGTTNVFANVTDSYSQEGCNVTVSGPITGAGKVLFRSTGRGIRVTGDASAFTGTLAFDMTGNFFNGRLVSENLPLAAVEVAGGLFPFNGTGAHYGRLLVAPYATFRCDRGFDDSNNLHLYGDSVLDGKFEGNAMDIHVHGGAVVSFGWDYVNCVHVESGVTLSGNGTIGTLQMWDNGINVMNDPTSTLKINGRVADETGALTITGVAEARHGTPVLEVPSASVDLFRVGLSEELAAAHWRLRRTGGFYDIYRPGMIVIFR